MKRRILSISLVLSVLLVLLSLSLVQIEASAQASTATPTPCGSSLTITGRVYSSATQLGIAGATVTANTSVSHPFATTTAADGTYSLNIPVASEYACKVIGMQVTAAGYQSNSRTISSSQLFLQPVQNFGMLPISPTPTRASTNSDVPWPDLKVSSVTYLGSTPACINSPKVQVVVANIGAFPANGSFSVSLTGSASQTVNGLAAGQSVTLIFSASGTTATADSNNNITETNESNNSLTGTFGIPTQAYTCTPTSGVSLTPTRTPTRGLTATRTRTPTRTLTPSISNTPTRTPTRTITPTPGTGTCSPVNATITAPFTFDGAGNFCWQSTNLGSYVNTWNVDSLLINGVEYKNQYVPYTSWPPKINGYWYVVYKASLAYGHVEFK